VIESREVCDPLAPSSLLSHRLALHRGVSCFCLPGIQGTHSWGRLEFHTSSFSLSGLPFPLGDRDTCSSLASQAGFSGLQGMVQTGSDRAMGKEGQWLRGELHGLVGRRISVATLPRVSSNFTGISFPLSSPVAPGRAVTPSPCTLGLSTSSY
jgi:hypothetical protein